MLSPEGCYLVERRFFYPRPGFPFKEKVISQNYLVDYQLELNAPETPVKANELTISGRDTVKPIEKTVNSAMESGKSAADLGKETIF